MVVELKRLNTRELHEGKQLNLNKQHACTCIYIIDNFKNIDLYKKSSSVFKKSSKLNYLSSHVLRSLYLIKLSPIHHTSEKKIFSRGSIIPRAYSGFEVVIHRGNKFRVKQVNN